MLEKTLQLGSSDGWDALSIFAAVGIDAHGTVTIIDPLSYPGQVVRFHPGSGKPPILIGKPGAGPGEIRRVNTTWTHDGRVHVYDGALGRESVFDTAGNYLDTRNYTFGPISRFGQSVNLPDGQMVVNATVRTREHAGYPLHLLDSERRIVRSFGTDTAILLPTKVDFNGRSLARAADGSLWVARFNAYQIEKWSVEGEHLITVVREPAWFKPWGDVVTTDYMAAPPLPKLMAVQQDADPDLLWLVFHVADSEYRAIKKVSDPESRIDPYAFGDFYDTIVEVIDIRARALVASRRFDEFLYVAGTGTVRTLAESEDGSARTTAWRMRLAGGQ